MATLESLTLTIHHEIHAPHDTLFARIFPEPELVEITLEALIPGLMRALEPRSLRLAHHKLVNDQLEERFADLLFEGRLVEERDVFALTFEAIAARSPSPLYRLALWLLRSRGVEPEERFEAYREAWAALLAARRHGAITALLHYAVRVSRDPDTVPLRAARAVDPHLGEEAMNYGDRLIQQGLERGRQEGRQEGRREGRQGQVRLLLRQLTLRFGEVPPEWVARLESADDAQLERWGERLITAPDLDALLEH